MLNGALSDKEEDEVANLLNLNETDDYRVIGTVKNRVLIRQILSASTS